MNTIVLFRFTRGMGHGHCSDEICDGLIHRKAVKALRVHRIRILSTCAATTRKSSPISMLSSSIYWKLLKNWISRQFDCGYQFAIQESNSFYCAVTSVELLRGGWEGGGRRVAIRESVSCSSEGFFILNYYFFSLFLCLFWMRVLSIFFLKAKFKFINGN